ncbi:uncharacterized protein JCM15063_006301 [Sporobolomyces koalae]|uniref:uncharacterized protein n=1 Tax=Sporobolomyces koalae TaxID=500713 RepID=UPI00317A1519
MASSSTQDSAPARDAGVQRLPSTVTRSMARRSSLASNLAREPTAGVSSTSAPSKPPLPGARRTFASSNIAGPLPRTRSTTSLAARAGTLSAKSVVPTSSISRARRVLSDSQSLASSTSSVSQSSTAHGASTISSHANVRRSASTSSSLASIRSPPRPGARRYSRAEAGGLTGFGVVKAGPRVASPIKFEREAPATTAHVTTGHRLAAANDPYSTSFQRPQFGFETVSVGPDSMTRVPGQQHRQTGSRTSFAIREDNPFARENAARAESPSRAGSPTKSSRPISRPLQAHTSPVKWNSRSGDENMDLEGPVTIPIRPSSPVRGALSPRSILGNANARPQTLRRTKPSRKIDEVDSSSSEDDDLDFLSPRKKAKLPASANVTVSQPATAPTNPRSAYSATRMIRERSAESSVKKTIDRSLLLRSPPPKKPATALPPAATNARPLTSATVPALLSETSRLGPASQAMQRSPGHASYSLPSSLPPVPTLPSSSRLSQHSDASTMAEVHSSDSKRPTAVSISRLPRRVSNERPGTLPMLPLPPPSSLIDRSTSSALPPPPIDPSLSLMSIDESQELSFSSSSHAADVSTSSVAGPRSEETAKRLANLQNMLSRLQMPRRSVGGGAGGVSRRSSITSASDSSMLHTLPEGDEMVPLAPPGEMGTSGTTIMPNRKTSLPVATSSSQRRFPSTTRPVGGIVDTSIDGSFTGTTKSASMSTTNRRISSSFLPSQSFDMSSMSECSMLSDASATAVLSESTIKVNSASSVLQGVVAFVDVRTAEGDDSGMIFVDMLKSMGARVTTRPSSLTTHIVFKGGKPSTLQYARSCVRPPKVVGIGWVVRCVEVSARADERAYAVVEEKKEIEKENSMFAIGAGKPGPAQKRRRSMEPKALAALNNTMSSSSSSNPALKASIAASLERARLRSLQFAPKVGSPLAKRVFVMPDLKADEDEDE